MRAVFFFAHKKGTGEVFLCLDLFDKTANFHVGTGALDSPILRVEKFELSRSFVG